MPLAAAASSSPLSTTARPAASLPPPSRFARMSLPAAWRSQRWLGGSGDGGGGGGNERKISVAAGAASNNSNKGVDRPHPSPADFCGSGSSSSSASALLGARRGSSNSMSPLRQARVSAWAHACVKSSRSSSRGASIVVAARVAAATMAPLPSRLSSSSSSSPPRRRSLNLNTSSSPPPRAATTAARATGSATSLQASAPGSTTTVSIQFDNGADAEGTGATLLTVDAPGADDLLAEATGVLDALGLRVQSAAIRREGDKDSSSNGGGGARLAFRVTGEGGGQVPEPAWEGVRGALAALWGGVGGGALSTMPAIYGVAAEAEIKRLRPLSTGQEGDAAALELAAAEMAQAAAKLVAVEREVKAAAELLAAAESGGAGPQRSSSSFSMSNPAALKGALNAAESRRVEAAAQLERRMAAMEVVLASRRVAADAAAPAAATREGPSSSLGDVLSILSRPMPSSQLLSSQPAAPPSSPAPPISPEASPSAAFAGSAAGSLLGAGISSGPAAGSGREVILQVFNWESHRESWYRKLEAQADEIAEAGFTAVWLPPPSDSVSAQGYLPRDLYKLDSAYGSEGELRSLVRALHDRGLKAIADIVINHRCAHSQDEQGRWNRFGGRLPWDETAICCNNQRFGGRGAHKTGDDYVAAPNIDHTQERVRNDLVGWLKFLRTSIGFDGWRFDYVKGYSGEFARTYIDATVPYMAFGEYWDACGYTDGVLDYNQDVHRQRTINWCDRTGGTAAAFDFTTKGILQEAMARGELWRLSDASGRPPGVNGLWPSRAITFIENHDTGSTLNHWPFPHNHLHAGHAYLLTHPGTPCVFYDHWAATNGNGVGDNVRALLKARLDNGLNCRSKVVIRKAVGNVYAATIDDKVAMKIGPGDWSPGDAGIDCGQKDWLLMTSGPQFAIWKAVR